MIQQTKGNAQITMIVRIIPLLFGLLSSFVATGQTRVIKKYSGPMNYPKVAPQIYVDLYDHDTPSSEEASGTYEYYEDDNGKRVYNGSFKWGIITGRFVNNSPEGEWVLGHPSEHCYFKVNYSQGQPNGEFSAKLLDISNGNIFHYYISGRVDDGIVKGKVHIKRERNGSTCDISFDQWGLPDGKWVFETARHQIIRSYSHGTWKSYSIIDKSTGERSDVTHDSSIKEGEIVLGTDVLEPDGYERVNINGNTYYVSKEGLHFTFVVRNVHPNAIVGEKDYSLLSYIIAFRNLGLLGTAALGILIPAEEQYNKDFASINVVQKGQTEVEKGTTSASVSESTGTDQSSSDSFKSSSTATTGSINGHDWVDLGLSVKWATTNVGAPYPGNSGGYYAWGETSTKYDYKCGNLKYCIMSYYTGNTIITKYNTETEHNKKRLFKHIDNKTRLERSDDAASVNWGGSWRMPTRAEWEELFKKCEWTLMSDAYKVTGPNGNSIILITTGLRINGDGYKPDSGFYWSSSLDSENPENAWNMQFNSRDGSGGMNKMPRNVGMNIRPVSE